MVARSHTVYGVYCGWNLMRIFSKFSDAMKYAEKILEDDACAWYEHDMIKIRDLAVYDEVL